jgi:hypothetical protein
MKPITTKETQTLEYNGLTITVSRATMRQATLRARLIHDAMKAEYEDVDFRILAIGDYPDVMAATISVEGMEWPITVEEFAELPAEIFEGSGWLTAIRELNPHWYQRRDAQAKKNADGTPTSSTNA